MRSVTIAKVLLIAVYSQCAIGQTHSSATQTQASQPQSAANSKLYVLIVSGINKDPDQMQAKAKAVIGLQRIFSGNMQLPADRICVLIDKDSFVSKASGRSDAKSLKASIDRLAKRIKPVDRLFFYYAGQANKIGDVLRLNLAGADITHGQLAKWLHTIQASQKVVVLDCPSAGLATKAIAQPGTIVISATRSDQVYSPRFGDFFVPALIDPTADFDGDGRTSLLEAFQHSASRLDEFYREQDLLMTEVPLLDDNGDGLPSQQPWRHKQDKVDGLLASKCFIASTRERILEK